MQIAPVAPQRRGRDRAQRIGAGKLGAIFADDTQLEVSGLNLTDELYYDAIYQAGTPFAFVAPGRAGYLTVKWKYD